MGEEGLPELNRNAAGIDVGNAETYVAVLAGEIRISPVRSFDETYIITSRNPL